MKSSFACAVAFAALHHIATHRPTSHPPAQLTIATTMTAAHLQDGIVECLPWQISF
jgi:hypothetical protein